jgi:hypothetical protein
VELQQVPVLCKFAVEVFEYSIKPFLQLLLRQLADGVVCRVVIDIGKEDGL